MKNIKVKIWFCLSVLMAWGNADAQEIPWEFERTEVFHMLRLNAEGNAFIDDREISTGDALGAFYESSDGLRCAGFGIFESGVNQFEMKIYGADIDGLPGYAEGEKLKFMVWDNERKCMLDLINIEYSDQAPNADRFMEGGRSELLMLESESYEVGYATNTFCKSDENPKPIFDFNEKPVDIFFEATGSGLALDVETGVIDLAESKPGVYDIKFISAYCLRKDSFEIEIIDAPFIGLPERIYICDEDSVVTLSAPPGYGAYEWSVGNESSNTVEVDGEGTYWVIVSDATTGCTSRDSVDIILTSIEIDDLSYEVTDENCDEGGQVVVDLTATGSSLDVDYTLTNEFTRQTFLSEGGSNVFKSLSAGAYELTVENEVCTLLFPEPIIVDKESCKYPILSPNGDGTGDTYFIDLKGEAQVFDRFGKLRRILSIPAEWDGTDTSGSPLPMGSYVIICNGNKEIPITLIR